MQKYRSCLYFLILFGASIVLSNSVVFGDTVKIAIIDSGTKNNVDKAISFTALSPHNDPLNHGTQVAKLIRQGSPDAEIIMLQVCDFIDGKFKPSKEAVLEAIKWSVENHVDVVNISTIIHYDQRIEKAIENAATSHGVLFVAAAGNQSISSRFAADSNGVMRRKLNEPKLAFPSSSKYVISVGALDLQNKIASYSIKKCDLYANGKIAGQEGTSFASARITAKIANILANQNPNRSIHTIISSLSPM